MLIMILFTCVPTLSVGFLARKRMCSQDAYILNDIDFKQCCSPTSSVGFLACKRMYSQDMPIITLCSNTDFGFSWPENLDT